MSRRVALIRGQVQGVGFRPFVYRTAVELGLVGFVRNQRGGVRVEVEGAEPAIESFFQRLRNDAPPLALIEAIRSSPALECGETAFTIDDSDPQSGRRSHIPPDIAVCQECLTELFDPRDRRFGHPFLSCVNCGPRLTIVRASPYDRERTSMAAFPPCVDCRREYEDPCDRRYHAQAIACPNCGPQLALRDAYGRDCDCHDPVQFAAEAILAGKIVALKGVGGYHLACDASNDETLRRLRLGKDRDAKPLAIMAADLLAARRLCRIGPEEAALLESPARPIVLLRRLAKRSASIAIAAGVSPCSPELGVMLPYAPLHHLLLAAVDGRPLVMTSGNLSDEPIVVEDDEALARLAGLADFFLTHDREILQRCDDSVVRFATGVALPIRRSRGFAPSPLELPVACTRPILALGGQQKATFALASERQVIVSHHLGDLDCLSAYEAYAAAIVHYERLFAIEPAMLVHDLHPDYASARYARWRGAHGSHAPLPRLAVQHHHAHLASCLVEHGCQEQVIGAIFDGSGYGQDGAIWGGEFLVGNCLEFRRAAHFRYAPLPGGERAVREPWRMALAHLIDAGVDWAPAWTDVNSAAVRTVRQIVDRPAVSPPTSSAGRLFDAVAALLNLRTHSRHEGQAAMELEWLADGNAQAPPYRFECPNLLAPALSSPLEIDFRPMFANIAADLRRQCPTAMIAARFHATLIAVIGEICSRLRDQTGSQTVALSGGCFLNVILLEGAVGRLNELGFRVLRHRLVPPGDGGLSLGQAAIAAARQCCENSGLCD